LRETITFTVKDIGEFEVYKTKTCGDEFKIEAAAAPMCGGGVELIKFKLQVSSVYEKVSQVKEVKENLMDLAFFMDLNENLKDIYSYAILKVMLVKYPDTLPEDMLQWTKVELRQVYRAYEVALAPFSGVKQSDTDQKSGEGVQQDRHTREDNRVLG